MLAEVGANEQKEVNNMAKRGRPKSTEPFDVITTRLALKVSEKLNDYSRHSGRSKQHIIQAALREYLKKVASSMEFDLEDLEEESGHESEHE